VGYLSRLYITGESLWTTNWERRGRNCSLIILRNNPNFSLQVRRKTTKLLRKYRQSLDPSCGPPPLRKIDVNHDIAKFGPFDFTNLTLNRVISTVRLLCSFMESTQTLYIPSGLGTYSTWGNINTRSCVSDNGRSSGSSISHFARDMQIAWPSKFLTRSTYLRKKGQHHEPAPAANTIP
jgi:hypothetical protein